MQVSGLTTAQARQLLAQHGRNELPRVKQRSAIVILLHQFSGIVALLLIGAVVISLVRGEFPEAIAIAVVLLLNAVIGFAMEIRSRTALAALQSRVAPSARALRDGQPVRLDARDIVPSDVLIVEAGDIIAADARLLSAVELQVSEATLTGESMPVDKDAEWRGPDAALAERKDVLFAGTTVLRGHAQAQVINTGARTEIGKIGYLTGSVRDVKSPLDRAVDALGRKLIITTLVLVAVLATVNVARGVLLRDTLDIALALAVAVIPEGLPVIVTVTLALGMQRLARNRAFVRRMHAVESLGSTTIVCADKTGTLTTGQVTLARAFVNHTDVDVEAGAADRQVVDLVRNAFLAGGRNRSADPIDAAIGNFAGRFSATDLSDEHVGDIPFSSVRRFSASFWRHGSAEPVAYVKGAPSVVLRMCSRLPEAEQAAIDRANNDWGSSGIRVIAIAHGAVASPSESTLQNLTFDGLVGFRDPPAPGVREAIAALQEAGIRTVMVTGDQDVTARAIAREVGNIDEVFSRIDPEQKLRIVESYQRRGEVVAMFGDGVNDAAALRRADVGVAMGGRGTDVAKEVAAVVLADDSFATIVAAVREGRAIFDNLGKFVFYLFSCNIAELLVILCAAAIGWPLPLLPLQILWLNLVTDTFPALALAVEPADADIMKRPPRKPGSGLVSRASAFRIIGFSIVIALVTMAAYAMALQSHDAATARTIAFGVLGLAQILHLGNARSEAPVLSGEAIRSNQAALLAVGVSVLLLAAAVFVGPLGRMLGTRALGSRDLLEAIGIASLPALAGQFLAARRAAQAHPA